MRHLLILALFITVLTVTPVNAGPKSAETLAVIAKVEKEGVGNDAAATAWKTLVAGGVDELLPILSAYNSDKPVLANWLRTAVDSIAEKTIASDKQLPVNELTAFVEDRKHDSGARRLAFDLLKRTGTVDTNKLLKLDDPGRELRRDAVALQWEAAKALAKDDKLDEAKSAYLRLLPSARDRDQVDAIADTLTKDFGEKVDLPKHFGFVTRWHLVTPFDNADKAGFLKPYPPEMKPVDLRETYKDREAKEVRWTEHTTADAHGVVDLNKLYKETAEPKPGKKSRENLHAAVAYGYAVVQVPEATECQLRVGSNNAVRVFVNGSPVLSRESYHMGDRMDQYVANVSLKKGPNTILVKVCQNDQDEDWAQKWSFQLRLCDKVGGAVPFSVVDNPEGK